MVVVFSVAIGSQAILLIVIGVGIHSFISVYLLDMVASIIFICAARGVAVASVSGRFVDNSSLVVGHLEGYDVKRLREQERDGNERGQGGGSLIDKRVALLM